MYPLVNKQFAIENGPVEIVDLPINSMVIFHSFVYVYQMIVPIKTSIYGWDVPWLCEITRWYIPN